jgi:TIR domain
MGVFIGWSGKNTNSYLVAQALRTWLEDTIQGCEPWVSAQDIDAGERWGTELFAQLDKHSVGIVCVTKENQAEPWLNFEAGALAKQLKGDQQDESRVCPLLIGMTINDVTGPLQLLQTVPLDEEGVFKVLRMVNKFGISKSLPDEALKRGFEKWWWPDLQERLKEMQVPEQQPVKSSRPVPEILDEILSIVRSIDRATSRSTENGTVHGRDRETGVGLRSTKNGLRFGPIPLRRNRKLRW